MTPRPGLNLTIKANFQVMRIAISGNLATGLEVESGGERFLVEGEQITLCAGAVFLMNITSPPCARPPPRR